MTYNKNKKPKKYTILSAIKEDRNKMLGSIVLSKKWGFDNLFKRNYNIVETIVYHDDLGISVIGKNKQGLAVVTRFIEKYPPEKWKEIVILRPKDRYSEKELVRMHDTIKIAKSNLDELGCYQLAVWLSKTARNVNTESHKQDLFPLVKDMKGIVIEHFTTNKNFEPISLNVEKRDG